MEPVNLSVVNSELVETEKLRVNWKILRKDETPPSAS